MSSDDEYDFPIPDSLLSAIDIPVQLPSTSTLRPIQHLDVALENAESQTPDVAFEDQVPVPTSQSSLIEEELVDSVLALMSPPRRPVDIEQDDVVPVKDTRTPFQRYRKRKFFSVSDLVGPLWCEVQVNTQSRSEMWGSLKTES